MKRFAQAARKQATSEQVASILGHTEQTSERGFSKASNEEIWWAFLFFSFWQVSAVRSDAAELNSDLCLTFCFALCFACLHLAFAVCPLSRSLLSLCGRGHVNLPSLSLSLRLVSLRQLQLQAVEDQCGVP